MKKNMNKFLLILVKWLKLKLDKIYYSEYTLSRETLIREMFPWLNAIWEYKKLSEYIASHSHEEISKLIEILYSFYWWEANLLVHSNKEDDVKYLKWILEFALALERFREAYLIEKNNSENK